jgi:hypothetical protein
MRVEFGIFRILLGPKVMVLKGNHTLARPELFGSCRYAIPVLRTACSFCRKKPIVS